MVVVKFECAGCNLQGIEKHEARKSILFFGDSVDYRFISYFCNELGLKPEVFGHPELAHLHVTGIVT